MSSFFSKNLAIGLGRSHVHTLALPKNKNHNILTAFVEHRVSAVYV